ncbi:hypothetical protein C0V78_14195 [Novosphingobium sp. TH158]|nr:hypothetical protein C0V78_14195 [Novosphingobium sp. TH158]
MGAAEWSQVPKDVRYCVNTALLSKKNTVDRIEAAGIKPTDARILKAVEFCGKIMPFKPAKDFACDARNARGETVRSVCSQSFAIESERGLTPVSRDEYIQAVALGQKVKIAVFDNAAIREASGEKYIGQASSLTERISAADRALAGELYRQYEKSSTAGEDFRLLYRLPNSSRKTYIDVNSLRDLFVAGRNYRYYTLLTIDGGYVSHQKYVMDCQRKVHGPAGITEIERGLDTWWPWRVKDPYKGIILTQDDPQAEISYVCDDRNIRMGRLAASEILGSDEYAKLQVSFAAAMKERDRKLAEEKFKAPRGYYLACAGRNSLKDYNMVFVNCQSRADVVAKFKWALGKLNGGTTEYEMIMARNCYQQFVKFNQMDAMLSSDPQILGGLFATCNGGLAGLQGPSAFDASKRK